MWTPFSVNHPGATRYITYARTIILEVLALHLAQERAIHPIACCALPISTSARYEPGRGCADLKRRHYSTMDTRRSIPSWKDPAARLPRPTEILDSMCWSPRLGARMASWKAEQNR